MAVKEIVRDLEVLQKVSGRTNYSECGELITDLIDTANAHKERCVGLSAIQIGVPLRVCVVFNGEEFLPFVNPVITKCYGDKYKTEEGCMSLDGTREVMRYEKIQVIRQTKSGFVKETYRGYMAQIIQHELDHFKGKLI